MLLLLYGESLADDPGTQGHLFDQLFRAGHRAVGAREDGTAIPAHFVDVATAAFVLIKQLFPSLRIAV